MNLPGTGGFMLWPPPRPLVAPIVPQHVASSARSPGTPPASTIGVVVKPDAGSSTHIGPMAGAG